MTMGDRDTKIIAVLLLFSLIVTSLGAGLLWGLGAGCLAAGMMALLAAWIVAVA
jgi:hypothetical protein